MTEDRQQQIGVVLGVIILIAIALFLLYLVGVWLSLAWNPCLWPFALRLCLLGAFFVGVVGALYRGAK